MFWEVVRAKQCLEVRWRWGGGKERAWIVWSCWGVKGGAEDLCNEWGGLLADMVGEEVEGRIENRVISGSGPKGLLEVEGMAEEEDMATASAYVAKRVKGGRGVRRDDGGRRRCVRMRIRRSFMYAVCVFEVVAVHHVEN